MRKLYLICLISILVFLMVNGFVYSEDREVGEGNAPILFFSSLPLPPSEGYTINNFPYYTSSTTITGITVDLITLPLPIFKQIVVNGNTAKEQSIYWKNLYSQAIKTMVPVGNYDLLYNEWEIEKQKREKGARTLKWWKTIGVTSSSIMVGLIIKGVID